MNLNTIEKMVSNSRTEAIRVAYARLRDREKAEDAVATASYRLVKHFANLPPQNMGEHDLRRYFFGILDNVLKTAGPNWTRELTGEEDQRELIAPPDKVSHVDLVALLEGISQLHPTTQELIRLASAGWSYARLADHFQSAIPYITNKLASVRTLLASWLAGDGKVNDQLVWIPPPQGEDFQTINQLSISLGRSHRWVSKKAKSVSKLYSIPTATQRDRQGHERTVFHKTLNAALALETARHPIAGKTHLTANQIADLSGRYLQWTQLCLEQLESLFVVCRSPIDNRLLRYYDVEVLDQVMFEAAAYQPAEDWLTTRAIASAKGWTKQRTKKRLVELEVGGEVRADLHGVARMHFPPDTPSQLN